MNSKTTMRMLEGLPKIYLSDAIYAQSPASFKNKNIRLVINTSIDSPASEQVKRFYINNGIDYLWAPLSDINMPPEPTYLPRIINYIKKRGKNSGDILIHCSAGINRSALVTAAILWYTTPNRSLYWSTPKSLIEYMRARQMFDRKTFLLINPTFYNFLLTTLK